MHPLGCDSKHQEGCCGRREKGRKSQELGERPGIIRVISAGYTLPLSVTTSPGRQLGRQAGCAWSTLETRKSNNVWVQAFLLCLFCAYHSVACMLIPSPILDFLHLLAGFSITYPPPPTVKYPPGTPAEYSHRSCNLPAPSHPRPRVYM